MFRNYAKQIVELHPIVEVVSPKNAIFLGIKVIWRTDPDANIHITADSARKCHGGTSQNN
jgi:hypothetical protein